MQCSKNLQADAYEQLGYQQEVPQYRAIFLSAAKELREGVATEGQVNTDSLDTILAMPIDLLFDFAAVHLIGDKASDLDLRINLTFTGSGGDWTMWIRTASLTPALATPTTPTSPSPDPNQPWPRSCSSPATPRPPSPSQA